MVVLSLISLLRLCDILLIYNWHRCEFIGKGTVLLYTQLSQVIAKNKSMLVFQILMHYLFLSPQLYLIKVVFVIFTRCRTSAKLFTLITWEFVALLSTQLTLISGSVLDCLFLLILSRNWIWPLIRESLKICTHVDSSILGHDFSLADGREKLQTTQTQM